MLQRRRKTKNTNILQRGKQGYPLSNGFRNPRISIGKDGLKHPDKFTTTFGFFLFTGTVNTHRGLIYRTEEHDLIRALLLEGICYYLHFADDIILLLYGP